jgi:hypothetical protein
MGRPAQALPSWVQLARGYTVETPAKAPASRPAFLDTDPELGMYDIRVFWLAAAVSVLAVAVLAYFKMGY